MLPSASTNRYGDMLKEFYKGMRDGTLSESRVDDIARVFNELADREQVYRSWLQVGTADPKFPNILAEGGRFTIAPLGTIYLEMNGASTPQTIPNDTETAISFTSSGGQPRSIRWDAAEPTKIYPLDPRKWYAFIGAVEWDANSTGRRALTVKIFDLDGVAISFGFTLHSLKPYGIDPDTMPFSSVFFISGLDTSYFQIRAYQNSGGDLNVNFFSLTIFEVI